jgi:hypothetical protein
MVAFYFISGPRHVPELSGILTTGNYATLWVKYMLLDEACMICFLDSYLDSP